MDTTKIISPKNAKLVIQSAQLVYLIVIVLNV